MRYKVIVNPIAGRGFGARSTPTIRRLLSEHGLDYELASTTYAGEAVELARQAVLDGYDTVVAAGGDGTYHEVINGMIAAYDGSVPAEEVIGTLGVLPMGSGSDLSYSVGVPSDIEDACARLAQAETKVIDLGQVTVYEAEGRPGTSRYFDNTVGIGFDGIVTLEAKKFKRLRGMALYLPVVLKTVFVSLKPPRAVIEYEEAPSPRHQNGVLPRKPGEGVLPPLGLPGGIEGGPLRRIEKTILMATICNGQREGGGFYVAPDAQNDDGLLDLLLADNLPRLQILGMIPHFMKGTHVDKPSVTMLRSRRIVITSPDPLIAHADGEMLCTDGHRIECKIAAQRVRVIG
jgi:diacylglycerol kinase (ATP)